MSGRKKCLVFSSKWVTERKYKKHVENTLFVYLIVVAFVFTSQKVTELSPL